MESYLAMEIVLDAILDRSIRYFLVLELNIRFPTIRYVDFGEEILSKWVKM